MGVKFGCARSQEKQSKRQHRPQFGNVARPVTNVSGTSSGRAFAAAEGAIFVVIDFLEAGRPNQSPPKFSGRFSPGKSVN